MRGSTVSWKSIISLVTALVFCYDFALASDFAKQTQSVSYDRRSLVLNGTRELLLSGSIHYPRVPPSDWESVILMAKELGLNSIQTYVFWNVHEPTQRGEWTWKYHADLPRFLRLIGKHDLYAVVRLGPYVCAEYQFGGLPIWLRNHNNISCFRCSDPVWKVEMERYIRIVVDKIRPYFYTNGGPIIALQVENEYPRYDEYLQWSVEMARNVTTELPWLMCHDITKCAKVNEKSKVLCSINGFWKEDRGEGAEQPSPEFFEIFWNVTHRRQPAIWTEDQGWFDRWEQGHRVSSIRDQLYGLARFVAHGGSYHNWYMLTGGNNYGYTAGGLTTTAYAPDTVIDSFMLRHEPKFSRFQSLLKVLKANRDTLLSSTIPRTQSVGRFGQVHEYGELAFLSNTEETTDEYLNWKSQTYFVPHRSLILLRNVTVLFNTSNDGIGNRKDDQHRTPIPLSGWRAFREGVGEATINHGIHHSNEQLNITENKSDYMWYSFRAQSNINISIVPIGYDGVYYIYVDGVLVKRVMGPGYVGENALEHAYQEVASSRNLKPQVIDGCQIDILSVAMGLSNSGVGPNSGKGIHRVDMRDDKLSYSSFVKKWKLKGESLQIYTPKGSSKVSWQQNVSHVTEGLVWFQTEFSLPDKLMSVAATRQQPNQTALVLNLTGLHKGIAYANHFHLGRYYLSSPGSCHNGDCAPPRHGKHCFARWQHCRKPTQSLYHIPFEILRGQNGTDSKNLLTVFEETSDSSRNLGQIDLLLIHNHPY